MEKEKDGPPDTIIGILRHMALVRNEGFTPRTMDKVLPQPMYMGEKRRPEKVSCGVMDWADGCQYQGTFLGQTPHGHGTFRFDTHPSDKKNEELRTGCLIEGRFYESQITGDGRYFCTDNFDLVRLSNSGRRLPPDLDEARWENCKEYVGEWVNNMREGVGIMTCKDGTVLQGVWVQDKFQRELYTEKIDTVLERADAAIKKAQGHGSTARQLAFSAVQMRMKAAPAAGSAASSSKMSPRPSTQTSAEKKGGIWSAAMNVASVAGNVLSEGKKMLKEEVQSVVQPQAQADVVPRLKLGAITSGGADKDEGRQSDTPPLQASSGGDPQADERLVSLVREQLEQLRHDMEKSNHKLKKELKETQVKYKKLQSNMEAIERFNGINANSSPDVDLDMVIDMVVQEKVHELMGPVLGRLEALEQEQQTVHGSLNEFKREFTIDKLKHSLGWEAPPGSVAGSGVEAGWMSPLSSMPGSVKSPESTRMKTPSSTTQAPSFKTPESTRARTPSVAASVASTERPAKVELLVAEPNDEEFDEFDADPHIRVVITTHPQAQAPSESVAPAQSVSPAPNTAPDAVASSTPASKGPADSKELKKISERLKSLEATLASKGPADNKELKQISERLKGLEERQRLLTQTLSDVDVLKDRAEQVESVLQEHKDMIVELNESHEEHAILIKGNGTRLLIMEKEVAAVTKTKEAVQRLQQDIPALKEEVRQLQGPLRTRLNDLECQQRDLARKHDAGSSSMNALSSRVADIGEKSGSIEWKLDAVTKQCNVFGKNLEGTEQKVALHERALSDLTNRVGSINTQNLSQELETQRNNLRTWTNKVSQLQNRCSDNEDTINSVKEACTRTHVHLQQVEQTVWQSFSEHLKPADVGHAGTAGVRGKGDSPEPSGFLDAILGNGDDDETSPRIPSEPRPPYKGPKGIQTYDEKTGEFKYIE